MKKFVVVMISAIVLFVFLMLNYLVWDKERLQNQRESDKIEQDWLRGQNRILTTTVDELEEAKKKLEEEIASQKRKISSLEEELRDARQKEANYLLEKQKQKEALDIFKSIMMEDVKEITKKWFSSITQKAYHESFAFLGDNCTLWGKSYEEKEYIELISNINSISLAEKNGSGQDSVFTILSGGEPDVIQASILVDAYIEEDAQKILPQLVNGINNLEVGFVYDTDKESWVLLYVITKGNGNP
ncbi:MAG: hypothetical protein GX022_07480 [Clostridiaceae bacterium]|nr:hypothetical protein [Clostridiaceae bacterium]